MKITALEIKQHEFEKSFRGYNIEEVDIFLNNIASEWERSGNESKMLRMQLEIAEKEAAKLREVEMSLIKALQNAEITSNKITEQAKNQAEKKVEEASLEAERIILKAKKESDDLVSKSEQIESENQKSLISKEKNLKSEINSLEKYRSDLVEQLKSFSANALSKIDSLAVEEKTVHPVSKEEITGFASSANTLILENEKESNADSNDLTNIEGIGEKISQLLSKHGVKTYRDVATIPAYKLKEILDSGGASYNMHDPTTWAEQAILAESGKWEELDSLKKELIGGREPEDSGETPAADKQEDITEEMLNRVNKVKAALKKAMISKDKKEINEANHGKKTDSNGAGQSAEGSFFDNLS